MTDTFTPPVAPDEKPEDDVSVRILQNKFGDGYSQRSQDGLNAQSSQLPSLTWSLLTKANFDTICNFFQSQGGYQAFWYTFPADDAPRKWICKQWKRIGPDGGGNYSITAILEQVFDLGA